MVAGSLHGPVSALPSAVNSPPMISDIFNKTTTIDAAIAGIQFMICDLETSAVNLIVTGSSSDTTRIPNANIVFSGSGVRRTVTITPDLGLLGTTTITISVIDGNGGTANDTFVLSVLADGDGDGIPDVIEIANGLNPNNSADASIDSDGYGFTNLQEFLAGTDPQNPASAASIKNTQSSGADVAISFATVAGKSYVVESNDNALFGAWVPVANNLPGTGGLVRRRSTPTAL